MPILKQDDQMIMLLGSGDVGMGLTQDPTNTHFGVYFSPVEEGEVGRTVNKRVKKVDVDLRIISSSPEGLQAIIDMLTLAKHEMEKAKSLDWEIRVDTPNE